MRCKQMYGYTLIEILIVLFIISIITTFAFLNINTDDKDAQRFVNEFVQLISLAQEEAILKPNTIGINMRNKSLHFLKYELKKNKKTWNVCDEIIFKRHNIPNTLAWELQVDNKMYTDEDRQKKPQIIISSNGDVTPFSLLISKKNGTAQYEIISTGGLVTSKRIA